MLSRNTVRFGLPVLLATIITICDQLTKGWIEANIPLGGSVTPFPGLASYFSLVHYTNTGSAFGLFRGQSSVFVVIGFIVVGVVLVFIQQLPSDNWPVRVSLGLQLGGAVGNLIDRVQIGHVTDFLRFTLPVGGRVYEWPSWNVADASLVVGVIFLAILLLKMDPDALMQPQTSQSDAET